MSKKSLYFQSCAHYPYLRFLEGTGFEIKFLHVKWSTTAFNRTLLRWGSGYNNFLNIWFSTGLYCTLFLLPCAILILFVAVCQDLFIKHSDNDHSEVLTTVIPGIDLPASELGYYSLTLIVCSVFHEFGHAITAVKEDVHLRNLGVTIFFILPVAYVNISTERLYNLNPWRALKILCAGIWHNIVLSFLAYLLLNCLPIAFSLFFESGNGVTVTYITSFSPLLGPKGFDVGDVATKINNCPVYDEPSWIECLQLSKFEKPEFCVDTEWIHNLDESVPLKVLPNGVYDCCSKEKSENLCFEYIERNNGILEIPPHMCLPVRKIVEQSTIFCNNNAKCENGLHCIKPIFDNVTNLFKINRREKPDIVYIGHASDLTQTIKVSSFIPRLFFNNTALPDAVQKFLTYIVVFSFSLGILNLIPVLFMDGEHITKFICQLTLSKHLSSNLISIISVIVSLLGTLLLLFHMIFTLWQRFF